MWQAIGAFIVKQVLDWASAIAVSFIKAWWRISGDERASKENAEKLKAEMDKDIPDDKAIEDRSSNLLNGDR
jgi:hypothetical protein